MMVGVMMGDRAYEIDKNFVIASFSSSFACVASARAVNFIAGGPVGISIIVNHRTGSLSRRFVLDAVKTMTAMLNLLHCQHHIIISPKGSTYTGQNTNRTNRTAQT
jgi:hypothetical protein